VLILIFFSYHIEVSRIKIRIEAHKHGDTMEMTKKMFDGLLPTISGWISILIQVLHT